MKKSLLVNAAVPATSFPAFALLAETPLTVNGSGNTIASVSITPSISIAVGGAMIDSSDVKKVGGNLELMMQGTRVVCQIKGVKAAKLTDM